MDLVIKRAFNITPLITFLTFQDIVVGNSTKHEKRVSNLTLFPTSYCQSVTSLLVLIHCILQEFFELLLVRET